MNRADLLLSCLRDGQPWTRRDIFEHTGQFFASNNAACELRKVLRPRGLTVLHSRAGRLDVYQIGSLREPGDKGLGGRAAAPPHIGVPSHRAPLGSLSDPLVSSAPVPKPPLCADGSGASLCPTGAVHPVPHRPSPGAGQLSLEVAA